MSVLGSLRLCGHRAIIYFSVKFTQITMSLVVCLCAILFNDMDGPDAHNKSQVSVLLNLALVFSKFRDNRFLLGYHSQHIPAA